MTLLGVGNDGGCAGGVEACKAAVLVAVMRLDSWAALPIVPGAWSVRCAG